MGGAIPAAGRPVLSRASREPRRLGPPGDEPDAPPDEGGPRAPERRQSSPERRVGARGALRRGRSSTGQSGSGAAPATPGRCNVWVRVPPPPPEGSTDRGAARGQRVPPAGRDRRPTQPRRCNPWRSTRPAGTPPYSSRSARRGAPGVGGSVATRGRPNPPKNPSAKRRVLSAVPRCELATPPPPFLHAAAELQPVENAALPPLIEIARLDNSATPA